MKCERVELNISEIPADLRERAELLARRANVVITHCVPVPVAGCSPGKIIIQMSPTVRGRLLIGHSNERADLEMIIELLKTEKHLKWQGVTRVGTSRK